VVSIWLEDLQVLSHGVLPRTTHNRAKEWSVESTILAMIHWKDKVPSFRMQYTCQINDYYMVLCIKQLEFMTSAWSFCALLCHTTSRYEEHLSSWQGLLT
jgi:hypothetical protein